MVDRKKGNPVGNRGERREQLAQMRRREQRTQRRRAGLIWGSGGVLIAAIVITVVVVIVNGQANGSLTAVREFTVGRGHVSTPVSYPQTPPTGGQHAAVWLNCGVYDQPVPNENAVHALEHGAVWVTYRPDLPAADVDTLRRALPDTYTILSPYPDLPEPVVVSAWGRQLALTGADDARLAPFIREFRQGPQTPEPGAACTGGTSGRAP